MNVLLNRILFVSLLALFYSCGTPKEMVLLQPDPPITGTAQGQVNSIQLQEKEYRIRPTDRLMLNIFSLTDEKVNFIKEPQMERVVDAKGQVELPVIGNVAVGGLTIKESEEKIKKAAADYLRSPSVNIRVMNFQVTVLGEVTKQGAILTPDPRINILEAIGQAGGLTENANRSNVRIVRKENNTAKIYHVNLLDEKSLSSNNFFLQPNDVVLVNPRKAVTTRQERLSTIGLLVSLSTSLTFLVLQVFNN